MPFGDHIQTYLAGVSRDDWGDGRRMDGQPVKVETADPPWWWSEYLMAAWKHRVGLTARRESRTGWQQDHDKWAATVRLWDHTDFRPWPDLDPEKPARHVLWEAGVSKS